jgi:pSer/pThr/pTyr-binding forkhead associated (FHA) protein
LLTGGDLPDFLSYRPSRFEVFVMAAFLVTADRRIKLQKPRIMIGRRSACDIVMHSRMVSAHHCDLHRNEEDGCWYITDRGSTNGTWVNDEQIVEAVLHDGDTIRLGRSRAAGEHQFTFECKSPGRSHSEEQAN